MSATENFDAKKLSAISKCTRILTDCRNINAAIMQVLQEVMNFYVGERVYVFELSPDGAMFSNTLEVCAEGVTPQKDNLQNVPVSVASEWMPLFQERKPVIIHNVQALDESGRQQEKDILSEQDIQNLLCVPLYYESTLYGFIGVDNPRYNVEDHEFLTVLGGIITGETLRRRVLKERESALLEVQDVLNNSVCGIVKMNIRPEVSVVFANDTYYNMRGCHTFEDRANCNAFPLQYVHPADLEYVTEMFKKILHSRPPTHEFQCRIITKKGKVRHLLRDGQFTYHSDGSATCLLTDVDITKRIKNEQLLELEKRKLNIAIDAIPDFNMWEYNVDTDSFLGINKILDSGERVYSGDSYDVALNKFGILGEDMPILNEAHGNLRSGINPTECELRVRNKKGETRWRRIKYFLMPKKEDEPLTAIGAAIDFTAEKLAEQRYTEQLAYRDIVEKDLLCSFKLNLTKNTIVDKRGSYPEVLALADCETIDQLFVNISNHIIDPDMKKGFESLYSVTALKNSYNNGQSSISSTQKFKILGRNEIWLQTIADLFQNPKTGDIECVAHAKDVDAQTLTASVLNNLSEKDYLMIMIIDGNDKSYRVVNVRKSIQRFVRFDGKCIDELWEQFHSVELHDDEEYQKFSEEFNVEFILSELDKEDTLKLYTTTKTDKGLLRTMHTFSYIDKRTRQVCYAINDVTDIYEHEEQRNKNLEEALLNAEQASKYKGEFMSRISHEIRTPLNAIVGYTVISKNTVARAPEEQRALPVVNSVAANLDKTETASRHLLGIINEVLDLSSIESGQKKITNVEFNINELLHNIANMFRLQAEEKHIKFNVKLNKVTVDNVVGDNLHINQIVSNLLSNAVKFTPEHGSVTFTVTQTVLHGDEVYFNFEIKDTGIGMSKEFMQHMYKPFVQENKKIAHNYGGTGLGLAISQNLVNLLRGSIRADSEIGKGTVFNVEIPLKISSAEHSSTVYNFNDARTLVLDFSETGTSEIPSLLKRCGVTVFDTFTTNTFNLAALKSDYNICLIECDNLNDKALNTLGEIRTRLSEQAYVALVTVYNDELTPDKLTARYKLSALSYKPLYSSTLFDMLVNSNFTHPDKASEQEATQFDFANKRVLLAEDNEMNREIALEILSYSGITVDTAENGQIAVDKYLASPPHTFDAILMDIIMPEMDGYEATRAIRTSGRSDAKSIPIIAMSANAFVEDITKSLESGMDNHISKPIDVNNMFKTLNTYLTKNKLSQKTKK